MGHRKAEKSYYQGYLTTLKPGNKMIYSRQLAQIIGPTLSVMTLSEMINLSIWESNIPGVTFLNELNLK